MIYKVGDRVRVIKNTKYFHKGEEFIIAGISKNHNGRTVYLRNTKDTIGVFSEEIERAIKMQAKLVVNGKEIEIEITEGEIEELTVKRKTGYERVEKGGTNYILLFNGKIYGDIDYHWEEHDELYEIANYYSDRQLAEDCWRADTLLRQLRRFAVEHRKEGLDWTEIQSKYYIVYDYEDMKIATIGTYWVRDFGQIYFDSRETAELAIDTFRDELEWYFTEFKDSL